MSCNRCDDNGFVISIQGPWEDPDPCPDCNPEYPRINIIRDKSSLEEE